MFSDERLHMPDPPANNEPGESPNRSGHLWLMGLLLAATVVVAGSRGLDSPWIQGDEYIFIANNPDVTGAAPSAGPTGNRFIDVFFHAHEDLYQPVTILTYAIEWSLWGDQRVFHIRLSDVLIHLVNALLAWAALSALLRRLCPDRPSAAAVAWLLAFVWALHPMLVDTYAADMGRTHLLATTFVLLSLMAHLRSLRPGGAYWFVGAFALLLAAMLNKPLVGWVCVVFAIEWALLGLRRTVRSPRVYLVGATCVLFAALTLRTTGETLMLEDSPLPLFGDPLSRAALNLWLSLRNFVAPLWRLSSWYPPDIHTGWTYAPVLLGAAVTIIAASVAWVAARRASLRGVAVGLVWCWAMWLPVSGLVGARVLAARDRYFYQPALGLLLAAGVLLLRWIGARREVARRRTFVVGLAAFAIGAAALPWDARLANRSRSTLARAQQAQRLNPDDPRVAEFLATAYDFSGTHDTLEARQFSRSALRDKMLTEYAEASRLAAEHPEYFRDNHDRAAFHRRISFSLWNAQRYEESLAQAVLAADFEPNAALTWLRLAHAYRALDRWNETRNAYDQMFRVMPANASDRAIRAFEFADLLLNRFNDPAAALPYFRVALADSQLPHNAQRAAILGAARCEVLIGSASDGYQLALTALRAEPESVDAAAIVALYHLRSQHWTEALELYREILGRRPTDHESLRGFQSACAELGKWDEAAQAWRDALTRDPDNLVLRSYATWSAACAGEKNAAESAAALLAEHPDNRFACLANALLEVRSGEIERSYEWVQRARAGDPLPQAREFVRTSAAIRLMLEREEIGPEAALIRAAILLEINEIEVANQLIRGFIERYPQSSWRPLAERMMQGPAPATDTP